MMKALTKKRNDKGFTLVELIVVIAILAVLMAILVPQYIQYVDKSRQGTDASGLAEVKHAVEIEAALLEKNVAGTITITPSATDKSKATIAAGTPTSPTTATELASLVTRVIGTPAEDAAASTGGVISSPIKLQSSAAQSYTYTIVIGTDGTVTWSATAPASITVKNTSTFTSAGTQKLIDELTVGNLDTAAAAG